MESEISSHFFKVSISGVEGASYVSPSETLTVSTSINGALPFTNLSTITRNSKSFNCI